VLTRVPAPVVGTSGAARAFTLLSYGSLTFREAQCHRGHVPVTATVSASC